MIKIYEYSLEDCTVNKYINEEEITAGMQLRIEGKTEFVNDLLESINYETIIEGFEVETENVKRVYIKVLATEIEVKEQITCKEFKETVRRAQRFGTIYNESEGSLEFDEVELRTIVWHTCDGLYSEIYLVNGDNESLLTIANIDGKDLYKMADTEENTNNLLKATKKALTKYIKWCENFDIKINAVREENC